MRIDAKQIESLTFWRQVKPDEYAASLAGRGPAECPYCHGHYPRLNITHQGTDHPELWCLCQCRDFVMEVATSRGMIEHRRHDAKPYRLDALQYGDHTDYLKLDEAAGYAQAIIDRPWQANWLTLMGAPGNGKSHILMAVRQALPDISAIVYADALADLLRQAIAANAVADLKDAAIDIPVLLIDDLGTEYAGSEFVSSAFNSIISQRYAAGRERPTLVSTNLNRAQLKERYGRTADRLLDTELVFSYGLNLPSWRTMFTPAEASPTANLWDTTPGSDEELPAHSVREGR